MSTSNTPITPLLEWLRLANDEQRERAAALAGTTKTYLYQLAGCSRGTRLSADLAFRLEDAFKILNKESDGVLPKLTARELSTMCALAGFGA